MKGEKQIDFKNVKMNTGKSLKANVSVLSGGLNGSNEMEGEVIDNLILDCNEFEDLLGKESENNYFDFIESDEYDSETVPRTSIIRFEGSFNIPKEFDMMELINQFKPMLASNMELEISEEEIFKAIFEKESTKVPVFIECDNFNERKGFAKINPYNLLYGLEDLEDFEEEDVTILAKVMSRKNVGNKPIVVFDVMKDLFSLNRALRRQMEEQEIEGIENIKSDQNILVLEILAIYQ